MNKEIAVACAYLADVKETEANAVLNAFQKYLCTEFSEGRSVDMGEEIGRFELRKREYTLRANSPHTQKKSRYIVVFKESKTLQKLLKK